MIEEVDTPNENTEITRPRPTDLGTKQVPT